MKNILVILFVLLVSCNDDINTDVMKPSSFNLVTVSNGATGVSRTPILTWQLSTSPTGENITYSVTLDNQADLINQGLDKPETVIASGLVNNALQVPVNTLDISSTYKWFVTATDASGNFTESNSIFSFTTTSDSNFVNQPPGSFNLLTPNNGYEIPYSDFVPPSTELGWEPSIDPEGGSVTYNIYIDNFGVEELIETGYTDTTLLLDGTTIYELFYDDEYSWYVEAVDNQGATTLSDTFFVFSTEAEPNFSSCDHEGLLEDFFNLNLLHQGRELVGIQGHQTLVYDDKVWILGGITTDTFGNVDALNAVWNSGTGFEFFVVKEDGNQGFNASLNQAEVFRGEMWVVEGNRNTSKKSSDGLNWSSVPPKDGNVYPARIGFQTAVLNDRLYVIFGNRSPGGLVNDVWSTDGVADAGEYTWVEEKDNSQFGPEPRRGHQVVTFNNKMWLIGGTTMSNESGGFLSDIYSSEDGQIWNFHTETPGFSPRKGHQCVVHDGKIWLFGGTGMNPSGTATVALSDVWCSSDGINWTEFKCHEEPESAATYKGREYHTVVDLSSIVNNIGVYGGETRDENSSFNSLDDIWVLD